MRSAAKTAGAAGAKTAGAAGAMSR